MTICLTLGSVKASIGSLRYRVREVRHSPGSALLSEESFLCFSAHSVTVRFSGGFMPEMAFEIAAFNLDSLIFVVIFTLNRFELIALPDAFLVFRGVITVSSKLVHDFIHLAPYHLRRHRRIGNRSDIYGKSTG